MCVSAVVAVVERSPQGVEELLKTKQPDIISKGMFVMLVIFFYTPPLFPFPRLFAWSIELRLRRSCARHTTPSPSPAVAHACDKTTRLALDVSRSTRCMPSRCCPGVAAGPRAHGNLLCDSKRVVRRRSTPCKPSRVSCHRPSFATQKDRTRPLRISHFGRVQMHESNQRRTRRGSYAALDTPLKALAQLHSQTC